MTASPSPIWPLLFDRPSCEAISAAALASFLHGATDKTYAKSLATSQA